MTDKIATILVIALIMDTVANIARMMSVEVAVKRQAAMSKAESLETEKRVKAMADVVGNIVKLTIEGMAMSAKNTEASECDGCIGNGIDCADECVKPMGNP